MNPKIKLFTIFISALLLAACASTGTSNGGGVASAPGSDSGNVRNGSNNNGAAAISADDKPLDVMLRAMHAQLDAKSFRAHITSTTDKGTNSTMTVEYAAPDRYRMVREGDAAGGAGKNAQMEFVIADNKTFIKTPNGGWVQSPIDAGVMIKAFRDPKTIEELTKTADVKLVGPDTLDGQPMLVYQYTQNNPLGMNLKSTAKTWLSVADGLPRKTETDGDFNGVKSHTVVTVSDFNSDIKIESPVK